MLQLFTESPWLLVVLLAAVVIVACTAIAIISDYLRKTHQAEIDASLKHEMLSRGMSAADIKTVLEASTEGEAMRIAMGDGNQAVRVGLGKFQVEVGAVHKPAPGPADSSVGG
ncbi:MAG: hypothetical protein WD063_06175 [Pirellulales bacterium]